MPLPADFNEVLLKLLSHENIASRAPLFEKYDKQVQGRTVLEAGEADAGVLQPFNEDKYPQEIRQTGVALSLDQCPRYNKIDAYWGAVNAVAEAARNVAAVGAMPVAITDCLCFGNPEKPEQMWDFTESVRGIIDSCQAIGLQDFPGASLPIVAGNVSLYNESKTGAIPASPMISCVGNMPDVSKVVSKSLQRIGSTLVLIGERQDECGGSVYYDLAGHLGANVPKPDLAIVGKQVHAVAMAIQQGLVLSAHDISDGGLAVAVAEMAFKNGIGVEIDVPGELTADKILFGETGGFILEVAPDKMSALTKAFNRVQLPVITLGQTMPTMRLQMQKLIDVPVATASSAWENGLREKLL